MKVMSKKGFFDSLFVLIILVLLTPKTHYINNQNMLYNYEELNQRMIITDQIVADALSDATFSTCEFRNAETYKSAILDYLDKFGDSYWSNDSSINCNYKLDNVQLVGSVFESEFILSCLSKNTYNSIDTKKSMNFKKSISRNKVDVDVEGVRTTYCKVTIVDVYSSKIQVDLNQSMS